MEIGDLRKGFISLFSIKLEPGLILRATAFAFVLPGSLNATLSIDRIVFLETIAIISLIFDEYFREIFSIFTIIGVEFTPLERAIGQFFIFVIIPLILTIKSETENEITFRESVAKWIAIPIITILATLFIVIAIRLFVSIISFTFSAFLWIVNNIPVFSHIASYIFGGFFIISIYFTIRAFGWSILLIVAQFIQSREYQNYFIVVLSIYFCFLMLDALRVAPDINHWLCMQVMQMPSDREPIVRACRPFDSG